MLSSSTLFVKYKGLQGNSLYSKRKGGSKTKGSRRLYLLLEIYSSKSSRTFS